MPDEPNTEWGMSDGPIPGGQVHQKDCASTGAQGGKYQQEGEREEKRCRQSEAIGTAREGQRVNTWVVAMAMSPPGSSILPSGSRLSASNTARSL